MTIDVFSMTPEQARTEARRRDDRKRQGLPLTEDSTIVVPPNKVMTLHIDRLVILGAPRTKKNSTTLGVKQSQQFSDYKKMALSQLKKSEPLPLAPQIAFNLEVHYYVDRAGERADLIGLLQATCDILQNAEIVENDNQFKAFDGSRIHTMDDPEYESPRAVITIKPLTD